ncbi:PAS domain-containing sensor histidine kinase [Fibrella forsythiae]|uniref:histidine kinase n=1 Tax=Fibrella forsythiae TaxID=2817061 RepID=A0ABS3JT07_9BACT|nr:PAS domain-containing protein [Fibrella forsythiae]MBO0953136.1 PAS domain-containing protein [Fibrella forsythiae]
MKAKATTHYPFLAGAGEMAEITRNHDWSKTLLGPPQNWPQALRVTLSLLLNARFPMVLFWGPQHLCFYNDAYRPSLNGELAPAETVGKPGAQVWPGTWSLVGPLIDQVLAGQEAIWREDQLVPVYRSGQATDRYWTFSYSPVNDESGQPAGVLVTGLDTTRQVLTRRALEESEAFSRSIVEHSPVAKAVFIGQDMVIRTANEPMLQLWGKDDSVLNKPFMEAMPELLTTPQLQRMRGVLASGETFHQTEERFELIRYGQPYTGYYEYTYKAIQADDGSRYGIICVATEVTAQVLARQTAQASEASFRALIEEAPVATCLFVGPQMRVEIVNAMMVTAWGKDFSVKNKPLIEALPELEGQPFLDILANVYATGVAYEAKAAPVDLVIDGKLATYYYDFTYKPLRNEQGEVWAIINVSINVTDRVLAARQLEASETKLRGIIASAPAGIGLFVGRDLIIETPNQTFIDIVGKGPAIVGLPLREAMPELVTEGQPFLHILDQVFTTGVEFQSPGSQVKIVQNGIMTDRYYNITYTPLFDPQGRVYAILDIAIDVTEQIKAQQALEETEAELRSAIELAELGTWSVDAATGLVSLSERHAQWLGLADCDHPLPIWLACVSQPDRERIEKALLVSLQTGGAYQQTYTISNARTGQQLILQAVGQTYATKAGQPLHFAGTVQDVTAQRDLVLALANQVQQRTQELDLTNEELAQTIEELAATNEELAVTNEEIASSNEEYVAINEELNATISLLNRSNENLQRFAYVASHDLQEPLRKIQQFGDLLKTEHAAALGSELVYLDRMQAAAARMSTLIRDLLSYARISTRVEIREPVSLSQLVAHVLTDLELVIEETQAQIQVDHLPTIIGDGSQLSQLFGNLLGNALKFRRPGVAPLIEIKAQLVSLADLPLSVKPIRSADFYHQLRVMDNGIGFEPQYSQRIFEAFQRLHRKHEYAGTGIGLSISERVVTSHGGVITASSEPGQGATFTIYLPA